MRMTSLEQVDTFRIAGFGLHDARWKAGDGTQGKKSWKSALEIVVDHDVQDFADDPVLEKLVFEKWSRSEVKIFAPV